MASDKYRTVIKHQHVRYRELKLLVACVLIGLVLVLGFFLGRQVAYSDMGVDPGSYNAMKASIPAAKQEIRTLKQELDVLQIQNQLDSTALEVVRKDIASQKDQIGRLEEGLRFYKGLMAPEDIAQGLSLRKLELLATEVSNRFVFRLVAQQEALKHATVKGSLSVELFGRQGQETISYPLAELSEDIEDNKITLRFRYFQAIEGELALPAKFTPLGFSVIASTSSPRKVEIREQFPWEVQERFSYVGK